MKERDEKGGKSVKTKRKIKLPKKLCLHEDASHGWWEVDRQLLYDLGIDDKVSNCSFEKGNIVYLEEDVDGTLLFNALKSSGFSKKEIQKRIVFVDHGDRCEFQDYERYSEGIILGEWDFD